MLHPIRSVLVLAIAWLLGATGPAAAQQVLVKPYVQPGDGDSLGKADVKVLCWLTDQTPGDFVVEFDWDRGSARTARPKRVTLDFDKAPEPKKTKPAKPADPDDPPEKVDRLPPQKEQHYFRYVARLTELPFNTEVHYRVKLENVLVREASFRTRATADKPVRFALVGDLANGKAAQKTIAHLIAQERPEFLVALGDVVYPAGRVSQYMHFFWNTYNDVDSPGPKSGAPLMASVPIYPVLGNHDVAAKLSAIPDALGAYYFFQPPKNGPGSGSWNTPLGSNKAAATKFRTINSDSYPYLGVYSFDYGPAHIVVLDSNQSGNVEQPRLRAWVEADLKATKARWKFACFHNPAFSSSSQHYTEQAVRLWQPLFEAGGVDMVFAGHVHNYQRTVPLRFAPASTKLTKNRLVDGTFRLDRVFDGEKNSCPDGIIYVVAGGGGATLYGPGLDKTTPLLRKKYGDNYADYTARMVTDRHSFTIVDLSPDRLTFRAIDVKGETIDRIVITKPASRSIP